MFKSGIDARHWMSGLLLLSGLFIFGQSAFASGQSTATVPDIREVRFIYGGPSGPPSLRFKIIGTDFGDEPLVYFGALMDPLAPVPVEDQVGEVSCADAIADELDCVVVSGPTATFAGGYQLLLVRQATECSHGHKKSKKRKKSKKSRHGHYDDEDCDDGHDGDNNGRRSGRFDLTFPFAPTPEGPPVVQ